jgi:hypothetical protein
MRFFCILICYICINNTEIMTYEEALSVINQALSAGTKAGVFTLKDTENIVLSLYKINEAIKVATEVSVQQTGPNSFVGGQVVEYPTED